MRVRLRKRISAVARTAEGRIVFLNTVVLLLGHATGGTACHGWRKVVFLRRFRAALAQGRTTRRFYRVASHHALAMPRNQHCPIADAFSTKHSTAPIARLNSDSTANTWRVQVSGR